LKVARLLDARKPHVLRNNREYDAAVAELDDLLDQDPREGTEEFDRLELLTVLIEAYDEEHHDLPDASPQEVVEFLLEQRGMTRADLTQVLGGRSRVSEFFSGKRELSLNQARALRELLGIPLDLLV
jgi:HTH-type transcriptional regulator/antitoxin HigA